MQELNAVVFKSDPTVVARLGRRDFTQDADFDHEKFTQRVVTKADLSFSTEGGEVQIRIRE